MSRGFEMDSKLDLPTVALRLRDDHRSCTEFYELMQGALEKNTRKQGFLFTCEGKQDIVYRHRTKSMASFSVPVQHSQ
jgi:hypothetical protein